MTYQDFITQVGVGASSRRLIKAEINGVYELEWPAASIQDINLLPDFFIIDSGSSGDIKLPDGRSGSVGSTCLFINRSAETIGILDSEDVEIRTVAPSAMVSALLENSETNTWTFFEVGEAPSQATANDLAGPGMGAFNAKLFPAILTYNFSIDQNIDVNRRSQLYNWIGGNGVLGLPDASAWPTGYYAYVINNGTSSLILRPNIVNLNGSSSDYTLDVGESTAVTFDGTEWKTFLDNVAPPLVFNAGSVSLPASGTKVLTPFEKSFEIQVLTGALTDPVEIKYGNSIGVWFVRDETTGGENITLKAESGDAGITPGPGFTAIIINDGNAVTYASPSGGTVTSVGTGDQLTGGPITSSGTINLSTTGVVAGSYGGAITSLPTFIVNTYGRLTGASVADLRATGPEAQVGSNNAKIMTPLLTATYYLKNHTNQTINGSLTSENSTASFILNKTLNGGNNFIIGQRVGFNRWTIDLGNGAVESSGNVGSNFNIYRYNDAGTLIDAVFGINRATGAAVFTSTVAGADPTSDVHFATRGYVNNKVKVFNSGPLSWVSGGLVTVAHGLGGEPTLVLARLVCNNAGGDQGYTLNQAIMIPVGDDNSSTVLPGTLRFDATNLFVRCGTPGGGTIIAVVNHATTGARVALTASRWNFTLRAIRIT